MMKLLLSAICIESRRTYWHLIARMVERLLQMSFVVWRCKIYLTPFKLLYLTNVTFRISVKKKKKTKSVLNLSRTDRKSCYSYIQLRRNKLPHLGRSYVLLCATRCSRIPALGSAEHGFAKNKREESILLTRVCFRFR